MQQRVVHQAVLHRLLHALALRVAQFHRRVHLDHKIRHARQRVLHFFARHPHPRPFGSQLILPKILRRIISRARTQRSKQQLRRRHAFIKSAVVDRLIADNTVISRADLKLHRTQMLYRNFHRSLRPGANRSVPSTLTPKFPAAKSFPSDIAERNGAANYPDRGPRQAYFGAKKRESAEYGTRTSCPACAASQPEAGALPPLVLSRWMLVARESTPVPSWFTMSTRSQGIESASGEGALATALPVTRLPSLASQEGPAKCLPKGLPSLSSSCASVAFSVHANCVTPSLQV